MSRRIKDRHSAIYIEHQYTVGGLTVTPFTVSHDGSDNVGYHIVKDNQTFTIATDLGCTDGRLSHYASTADYLMLESNYDRRMLINGTYAEQLKARILKDTGHLDNAEAARFVSENYHENLSHVFLCHLSNDNNTPEIAIKINKSHSTKKSNEISLSLPTATHLPNCSPIGRKPIFNISHFPKTD